MVSCLISAYYAKEFMSIRMKNLEGNERIVVCQKGSHEEYIARLHNAEKIITTPDVPSIGYAWNLAYQYASCEYVTTANTDDHIYADGYRRMVEVLRNYMDVGLIFSMVDKTNGAQPKPWKRIPDGTGLIDGAVLADKCIIGPMPVWRTSYRDTIGMFDEDMVSADWEYWLRMYAAGIGIYYIDEPLGCYAKRVDSLEHRNAMSIIQEAKQLRDLYRVIA